MKLYRAIPCFVLTLYIGFDYSHALPSMNFSDLVRDQQKLNDQPISDKKMKIGDQCTSDSDCSKSISGPVYCNITKQSCLCPQSHPVFEKTESICLESKKLGESCTKRAECAYHSEFITCNKDTCSCMYLYKLSADNSTCVFIYNNKPDKIDVTMLAILIGIIFMFIALCIVLQMFSRARFKNQRTIFNSPHPRLLKIRLGRKRGHQRRGSRQPSMGTPSTPRLSRQGSRRPSRESLRSSNGLAKSIPTINQNQNGMMEDFLIPPSSPYCSPKESPEQSINGPVRV